MISFVQGQQPRENQSLVVGRREDNLERPMGQWVRKARKNVDRQKTISRQRGSELQRRPGGRDSEDKHVEGSRELATGLYIGGDYCTTPRRPSSHSKVALTSPWAPSRPLYLPHSQALNLALLRSWRISLSKHSGFPSSRLSHLLPWTPTSLLTPTTLFLLCSVQQSTATLPCLEIQAWSHQWKKPPLSTVFLP